MTLILSAVIHRWKNKKGSAEGGKISTELSEGDDVKISFIFSWELFHPISKNISLKGFPKISSKLETESWNVDILVTSLDRAYCFEEQLPSKHPTYSTHSPDLLRHWQNMSSPGIQNSMPSISEKYNKPRGTCIRYTFTISSIGGWLSKRSLKDDYSHVFLDDQRMYRNCHDQ